MAGPTSKMLYCTVPLANYLVRRRLHVPVGTPVTSHVTSQGSRPTTTD